MPPFRTQRNNMKKTVKIIALTAVLILAAVMAASCGADYTKEELCKSAGALIEASYKINEVYFGEGLPISEEDSEDAKKFAEENGLTLENVQFLPVTEESPYTSIDEIKKDTEKVYSKEYCEYLYSMAFEGFSTEDGTAAVYAKYIEDEGGVLTARIDLVENALPLDRKYDLSSIKAKKMKKDMATVTVDSYIDGKKDETLTFTLVKEEDGWRLDTPTY